ncbi:MAG: hypothetical protein B6245_10645 [Desulfobacteraceae bacterium 4572_88]|nr:MAG: hypothetical protein B6245_10645 [Desulfobacteraceae bacterium 4572_88]
MARPTGDTSPAIEKDLVRHGDTFSFFQIVRLLERIQKDRKDLLAKRDVPAPGDRTLESRIRPSLSLDFPQSEVADVRPLPEGHEIITTFLGLYGVSSPLPAFYTEDLMAAELEDRTAARALLDIIHQHLYGLFYHSLKKYRPLYRVVEDQDPTYLDMLFSLGGLRDRGTREKIRNPYRLLRYVGLFSQQPRSALGLETLLQDAFPGIGAEIIQCVARRVKIPPDQRLTLGDPSCHVGVNAMLGEEVEDRTGKIRISLGPMTREQFQKLLNDSEQWDTLVFLIQFYLTVPLECDLELILAENEASTATLGSAEWSCLGRNAWLFSGSYCGQMRSELHLHLPNRSL